ncbi:alpha/beta fold hydrolase [Modestobacter sp. Leaf380]|uniref:alpha/beta fold hydrolase n=1 Tax=Modestobacter sp. Leaf380 TaxID=1736356 RepID=UPI000A71DD6C|nr:alpha/beta hydrolase [Modestobacter sp. Leaf380]
MTDYRRRVPDARRPADAPARDVLPGPGDDDLGAGTQAGPDTGAPGVGEPRPAVLSTVPLPPLSESTPAWPGSEVEVDGIPLYLRHTPWTGPLDGPADDAPRERALYVHGLGGAATNWTDLAGLLAVRCEGFAIDLPGFGQSEPPARGGWSIADHVSAVVATLEWVRDRPGPGQGAPVHLLGNSLGGLVGLLATARRRDLVATLTLVSPAMPVYRVPPAFDRAIALLLLPGIPTLAEKRIALGTPEERVRGMLAMVFGDPARVPATRFAEAVQEMRQRDGQPWAGRALTRSMRGLMTSYLRVGRANAWRAARSVDVPALVVWGAEDKLVDPRLAPRLALALPDARLQLQPGIGHVAMTEAPEDTARAVLGLLEEAAGRVR